MTGASSFAISSMLQSWDFRCFSTTHSKLSLHEPFTPAAVSTAPILKPALQQALRQPVVHTNHLCINSFGVQILVWLEHLLNAVEQCVNELLTCTMLLMYPYANKLAHFEPTSQKQQMRQTAAGRAYLEHLYLLLHSSGGCRWPAGHAPHLPDAHSSARSHKLPP